MPDGRVIGLDVEAEVPTLAQGSSGDPLRAVMLLGSAPTGSAADEDAECHLPPVRVAALPGVSADADTAEAAAVIPGLIDEEHAAELYSPVSADEGDQAPPEGSEAVLAPEAEPALAPAAVEGHNPWTHRPADPDRCEVCRPAKQRCAAAYRQTSPRLATRYGERLQADTIGPLEASREGARFILAVHDEGTGWAVGAPMRGKSSAEVLSTFTDVISWDKIETIKVDPGREFMGAFSRHAQAINVSLDLSVPGRPATHSRAERGHQ